MSERNALRQNDPDLVAVLDIGSAKTTVICGYSRADGSLTFAGCGQVESRGVRKGVVADIKLASEQVKRAVEQAENMASAEIARAVVAVGGPHIRGINSRGGIALGANRADDEDVGVLGGGHEIGNVFVGCAMEQL